MKNTKLSLKEHFELRLTQLLNTQGIASCAFAASLQFPRKLHFLNETMFEIIPDEVQLLFNFLRPEAKAPNSLSLGPLIYGGLCQDDQCDCSNAQTINNSSNNQVGATLLYLVR